jgi:CDP-paratose 2-epimerase
MRKMLVTGSGGLIGGEVAEFFLREGWDVWGVDNNNRKAFFGAQGDTSWRVRQLQERYAKNYHHSQVDISDRDALKKVFEEAGKDVSAVVHCAAQPSHDLAAKIPVDDFKTNVMGTFNMLLCSKESFLEAPFVFTSTNKVYGDNPNLIPLKENAARSRWVPVDSKWDEGIDETMSLDHCRHSLFGAAKASADIYVQEFGRYFNMPTVCLRGGCLTGPNHSGVELHGFLNYLIKCNLEKRKYIVYGYEGKQVRDNIHAADVARFIDRFIKAPRSGVVYNIGGGPKNAISILESFKKIESLTGIPMQYEMTDQVRSGDHQWYVSNLSKMKADYPGWDLTKSLDDIFSETVASWKARL